MEEWQTSEFFEEAKKLQENDEFESALSCYNKALKLFRQWENTEDEAETLLEMGNVYINLEDYTRSSEYYGLALKLYKKLKDITGQGYSLTGLALVNEKREEYELSRSYYRKAIKKFRKNQDYEREAIVLSMMARTYEFQGSWEDALMDYRRANSVYEKIQNTSGSEETLRLIETIKKKRSEVRSFRRKVLTVLIYLAALMAAEIVTAYYSVEMGIVMHVGILFALLINSSLVKEQNFSYLLMSMMVLPMIRILGHTIPGLVHIEQLYWFPIIAVPLFGASYVIMKVQGLGLKNVGFQWGNLKLQILVALTGVILGTVEYFILKPHALIPHFTLQWVLIGALILIISTGFAEELLFRGIIQKNVENVFGCVFGLIYTSLIFTAMHIGWNSFLDLIFVFCVAMFYGYTFQKTRSLLGITLSHGISNTFLFLIVPFLLG